MSSGDPVQLALAGHRTPRMTVPPLLLPLYGLQVALQRYCLSVYYTGVASATGPPLLREFYVHV